MRVGFGGLVAIIVAGCGVNPCAGLDGACMAISFEGTVGALDAVRVEMRGAVRHSFTSRFPPDRLALPAQVAVLLPNQASGAVSLSAVALYQDKVVAAGGASVDVMAGEQNSVVLVLGAASSSCNDGVQAEEESDSDCGGTCPGCDTGLICRAPGDCKSGVCDQRRCAPPGCNDGVKNGEESDRDCGGTCTTRCTDGARCGAAGDCASRVCASGVCQAALCTDGVRNSDESDVDCGGSCGKCADQKLCGGPADCASGVCTTNRCVPSTCNDSTRNGDESDVDCGGSCPRCAIGASCLVPSDCKTLKCTGMTCSAITLAFTHNVVTPAVSEFSGMRAADVDNDGKLDIVYSESAVGKVFLIMGTGQGTFGSPVRELALGGTPIISAVGKLDGDALPDLVVVHDTGGSAPTFRGMTGGTLMPGQVLTAGGGPRGIALADFDNDAKGDVAIASRTTGKVYVYLSNGNGTFTQKPDLSVPLAGTVVSADFDEDGKPDLAALSGMDLKIHFFKGNGDGTFADNGSLGACDGDLRVAQLTADAHADLVGGCRGIATPAYGLVGIGNGTFVPKSGGSSTFVGYLTVADFDQDGRADLAFENFGSAPLQILVMRGNGDGTFAAPVGFDVGFGVYGLDAGDFNSDGLPDIACVHGGIGGQASVALFVNTSN